MAFKDRIKELRRVKAQELIPNAKNFRLHGPEQRAATQEVLETIGWADGVKAFEGPLGELRLVDGHLRQSLALLDPEAEVPVIVLDLTAEEADALLAVYDPLTGMADLDQQKLQGLLADLQDYQTEGLLPEFEHLDTIVESLGVAWDPEPGPPAPNLGKDQEPDPAADVPARVQPGDLWRLGDHLLLCGSCTEEANYVRLLGEQQVDTTLTDPPYGLGGTQSVKNDYDSYEDSQENLQELIAGMLPLAQAYSQRVVLTPGNRSQGLWPEPTWRMAWFTPAGTGVGPWGFCCWQPIYCYGKDPRTQSGEGSHPDALVHTEAAEKLGHPCTKPLKFWTWLLERATVKGGDILEPFCGSGTGLIAAETLGRKCYAFELSPHYCDISIARWERFSGKEAVLVERVADE